MQLKTEIEIAAPPEHVWETLSALDQYPEWNPWLTSVDGRLAVGERLVLTHSSAEGAERRERVRVTALVPNERLKWRSSLVMPGIFDGTHRFELTALPGSCTRVVNGEELHGFMVQRLGRRVTAMARGFVGMNEALKKRVESR
jgi:hypothetical protein